MDTEISLAGDLNKRHKWGGNIKVYTRRKRSRSIKNNVTSILNDTLNDKRSGKSKKRNHEYESIDKHIDTVQEKDNNTVPDETIQIVGTEELNLVQEDNDLAHDQSLQEKENDTVPDETIKVVDTEELNLVQEKNNDLAHDQSLQENNDAVPDETIQIVDTEELDLVKEKDNDLAHDQSLQEDSDTVLDETIQIVDTEELDLVKEKDNDLAYDQSLQEDSDTVLDETIQIVGTEELNLVQEKDNDLAHDQSLPEKDSDTVSNEKDTVPDETIQIIDTEELNLVQEKDNDLAHDQSLQEKDNDTISVETIQIVDTEELILVQERDNDVVHDQSPQIVSAKDLNLDQETENVCQINSGGEISLLDNDQPLQVAVENGHKLPYENRPFKPLITKVDGRVRISFAPNRPKNEVRELKRKLEDELDQVKGLVQRLEAKKIQLTTYSASNGGYHGTHSQLHSQAKEFRALERVNSVVGSVGHYDPRPFQHLSVQVYENNYEVAEFGEKEKRTPKENQYYRSSEFLLAKDRLPPAESNKKLKTNGVRGGYGFVMNKYTARAFKSCNSLLARLMRHKFAWVFNQPVDAKALGLHDYHYIIRNPMDLGTIKTRLTKNWYKSPREFAEDVRLTFYNAMTYNPQGHDVHVMAEQLSNLFEDKWTAIESEYNYDWRYGLVHDMGGLSTPSSRKVLPPPLSQLPDMTVVEREEPMTMPIDYRLKPNTPVGRTPVPKKPKAKDPHKRDMTYDEKQRLSTQLQNLPSDKLDAMIQIIKKGNSTLSQHDDEIELDIDSVDTETLWELDRFVTNYKKNLSKRKRRAELAQARAEARPAVPVMNHAPVITQAPKESVKDQNNVATFPLPGELPGGSSSSSSSSSSDSDSDSDSSDSDSDSSSGSDAGHSPKS